MFSAVAESFIKRFCGKYLKNFGSSNITISVTGTITLLNIEIQTEEFNKFQLPFKLNRAFIGELILDLPFVLGGNFYISANDVLLIFQKDKDEDNVFENPIKIQSMIQTWISFYYLSLYNSSSINGLKNSKSKKQNISTADIENSHKLFDRFDINLNNLHIRFEEYYTSHIPFLTGNELMSRGILIKRLEIRPPTQNEKSGDNNDLFIKENNNNKLLYVNKILKILETHIYCAREESYLNNYQDFNLNFVKKSFYTRTEGSVVDKFSLTLTLSAALQKATLCFGPVLLNLKLDSLDINITEVQLLVLYHNIQIWQNYFYTLRLKSRLILCRDIGDISKDVNFKRKRAILRWELIKRSIQSDWFKFTDKLDEGNSSMKWRSWFLIWRLAARYVAIRQLITCHVGYESFYNEETGFTTYSTKEKLLLDFRNINTYFYKGKGNFDGSILNFAEKLILFKINRSFLLQMKEDELYNLSEDMKLYVIDSVDINNLHNTSPFDLSTDLIRVLYSLQLELDSLLPFKISAFCRIYADEKYELNNNSNKFQNKIANESFIRQMDLKASSSIITPKNYYLFIGIVNGSNIKANFVGTDYVTAYLNVESSCFLDTNSSTVTTDNVTNKINSSTNSTNILWGNAFTLLLTKDNVSCEDNNITFSCYNKSLFNIFGGSKSVSIYSLLSESDRKILSSSDDNKYLGLLNRQNISLQKDVNDNLKDSITVKIISCVAYLNIQDYNSALHDFKNQLKEVVEETKLILDREYQLSKQSKQDSEEAGNFMLDPSLLTIQDCKLTISLPKISINLFTVYSIPTNIQTNITEVPVNFFSATIDSIVLNGNINNSNPWSFNSDLQISSIQLDLLSDTDNNNDLNNKKMNNILTLPSIKMYSAVNQISSMGRRIGEGLDLSCFDYNASVTMFPFRLVFHPQSFSSMDTGITKSVTGTNAGKVCIWRNTHLLNHLYVECCKWAKGFSSSHIEKDGKIPNMKSEAAIRLGGFYDSLPKHLNVITSLWTSISHNNNSNNNINHLIPDQVTKLKCVTPVRSLDVDFIFKPTESQCNIINIPVPTATNNNNNNNNLSNNSSFFDWFSTPSNNNNNSNDKKVSSTDNKINNNNDNIYELDKQERDFYINKIKELQDRIYELESLNSSND